MKNMLYYFAALILCSCSSTSRVSSYTNWDENQNNSLDRYEFTSGYSRSKFFTKWAGQKFSIPSREFADQIFYALDSDHDQKLSIGEFDGRIDAYYFGMFNETFSRWDDNSTASIEKGEFQRHAAKTKITKMWDTSGDGEISEREMADGMFYWCDADRSGMIDPVEFNVWTANR
jgi:Ca2+-binding EF-hand superfamily protein